MKTGSGLFYHRYGLKLRTGLTGNARSERRVLEGFLIRVDGGYGCVHPWPELGDGTLEDQWRALRGGAMTPLVARALDCAAADGAARREGRSLLEGWAVPRSHATVAGEADFESLKAEGFDRVKLKGGREWQGVLARMRRAVAAGLRVRVDFNGTLDEAGFLDFWRAAEDVREAVDFVEDPVPYEAAVWRRLRSVTGCRLALDRVAGKAEEGGGWDVRVVKPALEKWIGKGGGAAVFTSYMDHPLGQVFAAWEAARYPGAQESAGLLTHRLFEEDAFSARLSPSGPEWSGPGGTGLGFDDLLERLPWVPVPGIGDGMDGRAGRAMAGVLQPGGPGGPGDEACGDGEERGGCGCGIVLQNPRDPLPEGGPVLEEGEVGFATSGSTGAPSVVVHTEESLEVSADAVNAWLGAGAADVWLRVLPAFHVGGWQIQRRAERAGSRVVDVGGKWDAERFSKVCQEEAVTLVSLVPAQVVDLVRLGARAPSGLRAVVVGGGALESEVKARAVASGWPVVRSYGSSEAGSMVAAERIPGRGGRGREVASGFVLETATEDDRARMAADRESVVGDAESVAVDRGSVAVDGESEAECMEVLPHWEVRLDELLVGGEGVLCLRGGALAKARFLWREGRWVRVGLACGDGWWRTSDRVRLRGRMLAFGGRVDRVVKVLGELVNLDAVEAGLRAAGLEAGRFAVVAMPEARAGCEIVLVVEAGCAVREAEGGRAPAGVGRDGASAEADVEPAEVATRPAETAVASAVGRYADTAAPFARVRRVVVVEKLPRSPLGKVRLGEVVLALAEGDKRDEKDTKDEKDEKGRR